MPTNRRPRKRGAKWQVTPRAAEIYRQMHSPATECTCGDPRAWVYDRECAGCRAWWSLHEALHAELRPQIKPFMFPIIDRDGGPGAWAQWGAVELWETFEAALAARA